MKRFITIIGVTLLSVVSALANIAEGISGDCTWVIDNDGNLNISSEEDYAVLGTWEGDAAPWSNFKEDITTVAFATPVAAKTCAYMFSGCSNLNAVYLDNFYTNDVTDMSCMFADCTSLEVIEFGMATASQDEAAFYAKGMFTPYRDNFITSNVTSMASMFAGCKSLATFKLFDLDTHNVTDFSQMFADCTSLEDMDLTTLSVNKNANVEDMFRNCKNLMNIINQNIFPSEIEDETFISLPTRGVCSVDIPQDCLADYQTAAGWRHLFVTAADEMKANSASLTAINNIAEAENEAKSVFSFAGERLSAPAKGMNIIDGKKVMVK